MGFAFSTSTREVLEQVVRDPRFRPLTTIPLIAPLEIGLIVLAFGLFALGTFGFLHEVEALRAMGLEHRLAAEIALNVSMETLLDPDAARARLIAAGHSAVAAGAETVILGCTGMAHHRDAVEQAIGVPVIEPCQAAAALAVGICAIRP